MPGEASCTEPFALPKRSARRHTFVPGRRAVRATPLPKESRGTRERARFAGGGAAFLSRATVARAWTHSQRSGEDAHAGFTSQSLSDSPSTTTTLSHKESEEYAMIGIPTTLFSQREAAGGGSAREAIA